MPAFHLRKPSSLALLAALMAVSFLAAPALAASDRTTGGEEATGDDTPESGEKLPAQLPSVTIRGEEHAATGEGNGKLAPSAALGTQRVRLPEPDARRATSEGNRALMVNVTPSTLEPPAAMPAPQMPYTSLEGGYGPLTQYQLSLYDSRFWGPALGITQVAGHSGWGWSDWAGKEALDWSPFGRLHLQGDGFSWGLGSLTGNQLFFQGHAEHGDSDDFIAGLDAEQGLASTLAGAATSTNLAFSRFGAHAQLRPEPLGDQQVTVYGEAQYRRWGQLAGPEAYLKLQDFWSLSDAVQLEGSLGGGYWGFEPILDPLVAFHYRPRPDTHLYTSLRTATQLPDFQALYVRRPAALGNGALQAEREEGWAEVGGNQRLSDLVTVGASAELKRSLRYIYLGQTSGLWQPLNATDPQWVPGATGRVTLQWLPDFSQTLHYGFTGAYPLNTNEHRVGTSVTASVLDKKLDLSLGLEGRYVSLSAQQSAGGGTGGGLFAETELGYALTPDWRLSFKAADVPLALAQPAPNYFVPLPILSANVQFQF